MQLSNGTLTEPPRPRLGSGAPPNLGGELPLSNSSNPLDSRLHSCEILCCHETNFLYHDTSFDVRCALRPRAVAFDRSATERYHTGPKRRGCARGESNFALRDDRFRAINYRRRSRSVRFSVPGQYTLAVDAAGFSKLTDTGVILTVGQLAKLPLTLQLASVTAEVSVTSDAQLVETSRISVATTVDQIRIDNLPINGRNYINFTLTNSQVARDTAPSIGAAPTSGLNVGGQRARANLVNVDGADAVDNSVNGVRSTVSQEAVQEFQIITNGYAAEYGRASGGVVNIVTRSGTDAFHGTAFGYLRNRKIQAVNPFSTEKDPAYTRVQSGFTLSGPLKKDKTFYFFSFENTRRHETGFSSIGANNFGLTRLAVPGVGTFQVTPEQADFFAANASALALPPTDPRFQFLASYLFATGGSSAVATTGAQPAAFGGRRGFASSCTPVTAVCAPLPASFMPLNSVRGNFPVFEGTSIYSLRLDHHFDSSHQLMLRGSASPSTVTGIQVNAQGAAQNIAGEVGGAEAAGDLELKRV